VAGAGEPGVDVAENDANAGNLLQRLEFGGPELVLERSLGDVRDPAIQQKGDGVEERIVNVPAGVVIGFDDRVELAGGVDETFLDFIATEYRQPKAFTKFFGESSFPRSGTTSDDDAFWFYGHVRSSLRNDSEIHPA